MNKDDTVLLDIVLPFLWHCNKSEYSVVYILFGK